RAGGGTPTAREVQQRWRDHVTEFADESERSVLETWQRGIDAVRTGDRSWAAENLDWAIKERLFTQIAERRGVALDDPRIERLDLAYHDIDPAQSVFHALQRRGLAPQVLDEARIETARTTAPTTTRAHLRGQVVTAAQDHGVDHVVDWTTLRLTRPGAMPIQILDPFATALPAVDALLEEIRSQGTAAAADPMPFA
ncbi:MAG: proteasome accessory factor PafA2 family protein, partial [Brachybacterium sp.]|nr:proteasome accessory factor PafA2 family protein [Brachybacterium sp.]